MDFRRRFTLLLTLGIAFSATIMVVQVDPMIGAFVGTLGAVVSYWVALILFRRSMAELQAGGGPAD